MRVSRQEQRRGYTLETRMDLLEHDADNLEDTSAEIKRQLNWILGVLISILVSTSTGLAVLILAR